jgi:hypothetical protein
MSKFCGACRACTFKTMQPATDCKFGSSCTRDNCVFAHASPAGSAHMAGSEARACTSGIKCNQRDCPCAHPSRAMKCEKAGKVCCPDCQTANALSTIASSCFECFKKQLDINPRTRVGFEVHFYMLMCPVIYFILQVSCVFV